LDLYGPTIAVPFDVGSVHEEVEWLKVCRRVQVVYSLGNKQIHLLGLTNPLELNFYRDLPNIKSINTGLPMLLAFKGRTLIPYEGRVKDISSYNYMDMDAPSVDLSTLRLLEKNIKSLRKLLQ
jgi:hypothetical protein